MKFTTILLAILSVLIQQSFSSTVQWENQVDAELNLNSEPVILEEVSPTPITSTTVEWGSLILSNMADSSGMALDSSFTFQLGFFQNGFSPTASNIVNWSSNWAVFDQAVYNEELSYFTSLAGVTIDGTSTSSYATPAVSFTGMQAYLWVSNGQSPGPSTEWFMATSPLWIFPAGSDDCCDLSMPYLWSMSDLDNGDVTPVWGSQTGRVGAGDYSVTNPLFELQTFTVVPELSTFLLNLSGVLLLFRRRRLAV